ncbi:MAG: class I SAM-dependent methyltransferase [Candidatus Pacearchaeota archaeon]
MFIPGVLVAIILIIIFLSLFWLSGFIFGAPFEPTDRKTLERMVKFAGKNKSKKVVDLGSGSGTIVMEFANHGFRAEGYEINPLLVFISRRKIKKLGLEKLAKIHQGDYRKVNLSKFNIVCIFQISYVMKNIESKLKIELKKGSKIISNTWKFKDMKPKKKEKGVYLYEV